MLLAYQPHERGEVVRARLAVVIGQRAEHHDRRDQEVFSRSRFLSIGCTCRKHRRTLLSLRARGAPRRQGSPATRLCFWCLLDVNGGITRQLISSPIGPISTMDLARSSTAQRDTVLTSSYPTASAQLEQQVGDEAADLLLLRVLKEAYYGSGGGCQGRKTGLAALLRGRLDAPPDEPEHRRVAGQEPQDQADLHKEQEGHVGERGHEEQEVHDEHPPAHADVEG